MIERTWAADLNPTYDRMSDVKSQLFVSAVLLELEGRDPGPEVDEQFLIKVLNKRCEVHKLPITFTPQAKLAILALADRPGSVMALLVDALNAYEHQTVTVGMLADLYPTGFYDELTLFKFVDDYIKPKKVKWAEIY